MLLMTWASLLYSALVALCLSMERHQRQVLSNGRPRLSARWLRLAGFAGLLVSLLECVGYSGTTCSWVDWFCVLAVLGGAVNLALTYRPGTVLPSAKASAVLAVVGLGVRLL